MSVFNSLGSNYSASFVWQSLYKRGSKHKSEVLIQALNTHFGGKTLLTYKGRQALEIALKRAGLPKGSTVAINGFTCYVVYQAVKNAGLEPVMIDVAPDQFDFGIKGLEAAHKKHKNLRAVIIQNTLGFPVDVQKIEAYCRRHNLVLVEDLAHSLGTIYADGREAGTVGDLVMLSFSQDKPLDVVAGGACIDRRSESPDYESLSNISRKQQFINRTYPFWTLLIRGTYASGIGRVLHAGLKKLHLLATPMSDNVRGLYGFTTMGRGLLSDLWQNREVILKHRRDVARVYQELLPKDVQYAAGKGTTAYLRFPIHVTDRVGLVAHLKQHHIYIGDTWYDAPISPKRYQSFTEYKAGECPRAERLATEIVNLPTHRHVNPARARFIAEKVNQWLKSA